MSGARDMDAFPGSPGSDDCVGQVEDAPWRECPRSFVALGVDGQTGVGGFAPSALNLGQECPRSFMALGVDGQIGGGGLERSALNLGQVEDAPWRECPTSLNAGFTLVEVLAAVAILGGALFILLNTHHSALRLYSEMNETVVHRQLLERVVGEAEFGVLTGELTGSGEFKGRYAGYYWSYQGAPTGGGEDIEMPFYQVEATLRTPEDEDETLTFYIFDVGSNEVLEGET